MSPMNKRFVNCQIPKPDWVWKERTTTPSQLPSFDPELNRVESSAHLQAPPWRFPAGACTPARNRAGPHDIDCWINFWKPLANAAGTLPSDDTRSANSYNGTLVHFATSNGFETETCRADRKRVTKEHNKEANAAFLGIGGVCTGGHPVGAELCDLDRGRRQAGPAHCFGHQC